MKKINPKLLIVGLVTLLAFGAMIPSSAYADEEASESSAADNAKTSEENNGTSISLMPVSKVLQISSNATYEDTISVANDGNSPIEIEVYAAPYSYVYSEEDSSYRLGFSNENSFTQLSRWITFEDGSRNWVEKAKYTIAPKSSLEVKYKITTPSSIPAGGQYAVIFAHTLTSVVSGDGIRTEASPGMVIYGRSTEGETKIDATVSDMKIQFGVSDGVATRNNFYASAKVKNSGNVDFNAVGTMKVSPIFGFSSYETSSTSGRISVIPEAELELHDEWTESPGFGLYKVTWTVVAGDKTETIDSVIFVNPLPTVIITIILLTGIIMWIIIVVRKRKERQARLAV